MKSIIRIVLLVIVFCASLSLQSNSSKGSCNSASGKFRLVPLFELYNSKTETWFYTTSVREMNNFIKNKCYIRKDIIGQVAVSSTDCNEGKSLIPVSRLYNSKSNDYLYQSKCDESHEKNSKYDHEKIAFYGADTTKRCGASLTLYRFWNGKSHIYATNSDDDKRKCGRNYTFEGIICYIWPPPKPESCKPPKPKNCSCSTGIPSTTTTTTTAAPKTTTTTTTTTTTEAPTTTTPRPNITPPSNCTMKFARLFRLYNYETDSHLYTTSYDEAVNAYQVLSYDPEKPPGRVTTDASDCFCTKTLKPIYRLDKPAPNEDHFYTMSSEEASNAVSKLGYSNKGIAYYCSSNSGYCGATLALHQYTTSNAQHSHFYTSDLNEGKQNVTSVGGTYEGILCYIWPDA